MNLTLDANIWVIASDFSDLRQTICHDVLNKIAINKNIRVFSPYLMEVEVLASIARLNRGENGAEKVKEASQWMWTFPRQTWKELDSIISADASRCASKFFLRGADAVYVATALKNEATLITYDKEIINRAPPSGVKVMQPDEWLARHAKQGGA